MKNIFANSKKEADEIQNLLDKNFQITEKPIAIVNWLMAFYQNQYEDFEKRKSKKQHPNKIGEMTRNLNKWK